jgi:hypothetical protein
MRMRVSVTVGKPAGAIGAEQFLIDGCKVGCGLLASQTAFADQPPASTDSVALQESRIYLMDSSSTVTIDECNNCDIYIGPVQGSVFIRNSRNCRVVVACQQFR